MVAGFAVWCWVGWKFGMMIVVSVGMCVHVRSRVSIMALFALKRDPMGERAGKRMLIMVKESLVNLKGVVLLRQSALQKFAMWF